MSRSLEQRQCQSVRVPLWEQPQGQGQGRLEDASVLQDPSYG